MPFFQYSATDKQGKVIAGTLQAASIEDATNALFKGGLSVSFVQDASRQSMPQAQPPVQRIPSQSRTAVSEAPARQVVVDPAQIKRLLGEPVKTKPGTEKEIYFIFTQLAAYLRSGISPA